MPPLPAMNFNGYEVMKFCPVCGINLTTVETPIDNVKDCAEDMQHTIGLYHYADMMEEMLQAYREAHPTMPGTELEQFLGVLNDLGVQPGTITLRDAADFLHSWDAWRRIFQPFPRKLTLDEIWVLHRTGRIALAWANYLATHGGSSHGSSVSPPGN